MNRSRWPIPLTLAALALGGAGVWRYAMAQVEPAPPSAGGREGRAGGRGTGFQAFGGGGAQLAVSGDSVFILRGNTLYRLDAASLAVRAQADLPAPAPMAEGAPAVAPEPPGGASTGPDAALVASGRKVFSASGCMNCHSIAGQGRGRAPDLTNIGSDAGHTPQWIAAYVKSPTSVDPDSRMPPFGDRINDTDLHALGVYLAAFK